MNIKEIKKIYNLKKREIIQRLKEFEKIWREGNDEELFGELSFCILTPQSKAKLCWPAIERLRKKNLMSKGNAKKIEKELFGVRFKNNKAKYIVEARKFFKVKDCLEKFSDRPTLGRPTGDDVFEKREWLVKNIKGLGLKEASHFLRNIGFGEKIAILDRHILKNLKLFKVIKEIPKSLTKNKYYEIEEKMKKFSDKIKIPLSHLDLLFWSKETGEIFK